MTQTKIEHNIPETTFENLFLEDPLSEKLFAYWLGKAWSDVRPHFEKMGRAGAEATPYSRIADRQLPVLTKADEASAQEIKFDGAYQKLRALSYGEGIISIKFDPRFLAKHKAVRHMVGFGAGYYFAQTETGLYCPICMTDALARVLELHGRDDETQTTLAHLTTHDLKSLWEGAMFLTERQGGSDVGANLVRAEKREGRWFLSGHKWFCSNANASAILVLARMPGEEGALEKGTRGLGLFLILPEGHKNIRFSMEYHKLKDKLGVRSMASAEITLHETPALLIGGAGEGFKMMADMVNMSRLYNSIASVAVAKRALLEACAYGKSRTAFGATLQNLPLWRSEMADLVAEHLGILFLVFEGVRALDQADLRNQEAATLARLITPLAKGTSAKFSVWACSEAMELIGGNAYIEDHILPRLLRDAQVLPIWEGTTNIQSLDALRAVSKEGVGALMARIQKALLAAENAKLPTSLLNGLKSELAAYQEKLQATAQANDVEKERGARWLLEKTSRLFSMALLAEASSHADLKEVTQAALHRLLKRPGLTAPLGLLTDVESVNSEEILIKNII